MLSNVDSGWFANSFCCKSSLKNLVTDAVEQICLMNRYVKLLHDSRYLPVWCVKSGVKLLHIIPPFRSFAISCREKKDLDMTQNFFFCVKQFGEKSLLMEALGEYAIEGRNVSGLIMSWQIYSLEAGTSCEAFREMYPSPASSPGSSIGCLNRVMNWRISCQQNIFGIMRTHRPRRSSLCVKFSVYLFAHSSTSD